MFFVGSNHSPLRNASSAHPSKNGAAIMVFGWLLGSSGTEREEGRKKEKKQPQWDVLDVVSRHLPTVQSNQQQHSLFFIDRRPLILSGL